MITCMTLTGLTDHVPLTVLLLWFCCANFTGAGAGSLADSTICPLPSRMATRGCWVVCVECCTWSHSYLLQVVIRLQVVVGFNKAAEIVDMREEPVL